MPFHKTGYVKTGYIKTGLVKLMGSVPPGRVTTFDCLAAELGASPRVIMGLIDTLSEDERQFLPWHRIVAKGGALRRHAHRDAQFASLIAEGIAVSAAGIVQDMARVTVMTFDGEPAGRERAAASLAPPATGSRSRGMKDRPR